MHKVDGNHKLNLLLWGNILQLSEAFAGQQLGLWTYS